MSVIIIILDYWYTAVSSITESAMEKPTKEPFVLVPWNNAHQSIFSYRRDSNIEPLEINYPCLHFILQSRFTELLE